MLYDIILREPRIKNARFVYVIKYATREEIKKYVLINKGNFKKDYMVIESGTEKKLYRR